MTTPTASPNPWAARMRRSTKMLAGWTASWVASLALASFGPGALWPEQRLPTLLAIGFSGLLGIGMLVANKRHLLDLDELQRTLQLQAMAWALGAGLVAGITWTLLERHQLVSFAASISNLVMFMALAYLAAIVLGLRRYL